MLTYNFCIMSFLLYSKFQIFIAENKFAVGSGDKLISVSYFVSENNWWLSKHIKRPLRSTVTAIDWHPDNKVLVAGSTDWKVRVFGAYVKDVEDAPGPGPWGATSSLGTLLAEFPNSPNGGESTACLAETLIKLDAPIPELRRPFV